jgi:hypothetical protein
MTSEGGSVPYQDRQHASHLTRSLLIYYIWT